MNILLPLYSILAVTVIFLWLRMAVAYYNVKGAKGLLIFFSHCILALIVMFIIWIIIISPVFFFEEEEDFPISETILFFSLIIVLLGNWALLVSRFLNTDQQEVNELMQTK